MSQDYRELLGTDYLSDSRGYLNTTFDALRTCFAGATAPTSPVAYMCWLDTTNSYLKQRNAANDAWIVLGVLGAEYYGMLPLTGGTMSGAIVMGGNGITDLPLGTGTAAARQQEVDAKAPIAAPVFTGDAKVSQDPAGNDSIPRRSWTEGRYLKLTGGAMTGAIVLSGIATADLHPAGFKQVKDLVTFNTTSGHRHDGSDARRVKMTDLDLAGYTPLVWSRLLLPDNEQLILDTDTSVDWTTLGISGYGVPAAAHAAFLKVILYSPGGAIPASKLQLRKTGTTPTDPQTWEAQLGVTEYIRATTFVDCVGQHFDYKLTFDTSPVGSVKIYLLGYMTTVGA